MKEEPKTGLMDNDSLKNIYKDFDKSFDYFNKFSNTFNSDNSNYLYGKPINAGGVGTTWPIPGGTFSSPNTLSDYFSVGTGTSIPGIGPFITQKINTYFIKEKNNVMKGRYEKTFLTNILGLTIEPLKGSWFLLKENNIVIDDPSLTSNFKGIQLSLIHKCKRKVPMYSKFTGNLTAELFWCSHCEDTLPDELVTMLTMSYIF